MSSPPPPPFSKHMESALAAILICLITGVSQSEPQPTHPPSGQADRQNPVWGEALHLPVRHGAQRPSLRTDRRNQPHTHTHTRTHTQPPYSAGSAAHSSVQVSVWIGGTPVQFKSPPSHLVSQQQTSRHAASRSIRLGSKWHRRTSQPCGGACQIADEGSQALGWDEQIRAGPIELDHHHESIGDGRDLILEKVVNRTFGAGPSSASIALGRRPATHGQPVPRHYMLQRGPPAAVFSKP